MNYKISIIIPIHNIEKYLAETLDSIINQSIGHENLEVIMVNDFSTDNSANIINQYAEKYDNFKAIHLEENSGLPGKPRNLGMDTATGKYVMFMDHDDAYVRDAMEVLYDKVDSVNADMAFSRFIHVFKGGKIRENYNPFEDVNEIHINSIDEDERLFKIAPSIWTKIFRRKFLINNNIRFPEGVLAEDMSFVVHSLLKAKGIVYLNNFFSYKYRIRDSDGEKSTIHIRNKKYLMAIINGYYDTYSILKELNQAKYFHIIFRTRINLWLNSFILSDASTSDKLELLKRIRFFLEKFEKNESPWKLNKKYGPLNNHILKKEYEEAIELAELMGKYTKSEINLKNKVNSLQNQLKSRKKQIAELQSFNGWLNYKTHNISSRWKKKFE